MSISVIELAGVLVACTGAGASLVLLDPRARYAAMGLGLFAAVLLLVGQVADEGRLGELTSQPAAVVLGLVLGGVALGATAATFQRVPAAFAIAAFAVIPLRVPIEIGGETNFLLIPLYGVIAGGFARGAWLCVMRRDSELRTLSAPRADEARPVRYLSFALAASLVIYGLGAAWSEDPTSAIRTVAFFLAPFASLLALLRDVRWHRKLMRQVLFASALVTLGFAVLALIQYAGRDLLLNQDLQDANQLHLYFRVNSLFRDPNIFGRYLALVIVAIAAWVSWRRPAREAIAGIAVAAVLLAALFFTYSQTSFVALIAGLGLLVWLRFGYKGFAGAGALAALALAAVLILGGPTRDESVDRGRTDLAEVSSGRTDLIGGGIDLFQMAPVAGQGSGAFAISYRQKIERIQKPVSHTEPVTVAAEQGVLGLVPYVAVLLFAGLVLFRPWPVRTPARAGVAAAFFALFVHSVGYAGFASDPATWGLLALGLALRE